MSEQARKTWTESTPHWIAVSMSSFSALARPQISAERPAFAIRRTPSCSPFEVIGKPASITSTPSLSSACAIWSFSSGIRETPGVCSPSRSVVSKTLTILFFPFMRSALGDVCRSRPGKFEYVGTVEPVNEAVYLARGSDHLHSNAAVGGLDDTGSLQPLVVETSDRSITVEVIG